MRCNNCGWNNSSKLIRCEKCNYPLDGSLNIREDQAYNPPSNADEAAKTVKGQSPIIEPWDEGAKPVKKDEEKKDKAEYILKQFKDIKGSDSNDIKISSNPDDNDDGTINPFSKAKGESSDDKKNHFSIIINRLDPETNEVIEKKELVVNDSNLNLNRELINPENRTISKESHAELKFVEDKIFIKNNNLYFTTFIRVDDLYEIKKGSFILLGNELIEIK